MNITPSENESGDGRSGETERVLMQGISLGNSTFNQVAGDQHIIYEQIPVPSRAAFTLPADTLGFTGRSDQLAEIRDAAIAAAEAGQVVAIHAIDGMPGVGKTTLAVHIGHMVASRFPDRQLFVNLHAHTPGQRPADPSDVLAMLLAADGVEPGYLPDGLDARASMWRDRLAGRRALLILDNAASSEQVIPLLPGTGSCLVLVTSRRYLGDLPMGRVSIPLDVLPADDACTMFIRLAPRAGREPGEVAHLVGLSGYLPLAISLLASLFTKHESWAMSDLIQETKAKLLTVRAENRTVAAAFELSYQYLTAGQQRFFRHLGLHPGPDIDPYAAAALTGLQFEDASEILDHLHSDRLLAEPLPHRYRMHDLIHEYARSLAAADGFEDE
jgi:NB-ARC domain